MPVGTCECELIKVHEFDDVDVDDVDVADVLLNFLLELDKADDEFKWLSFSPRISAIKWGVGCLGGFP